MKTSALILAVALFLPGCVPSTNPASTPPPEQSDDLVRTGIGRTASVNGPKVTPLTVLEDSRCPMNARCVWAGRVRLSVRIDLGTGSETRELTPGTPVPVADGMLKLVEVQPDKVAGAQSKPLTPRDYRFGFRFQGGL
jgi:hypothetical protein